MVLLQNRPKFQLALANLPTLQLFAAPPSEVLGLVQSILEEFYTDGIDQVVSAQLDDKGDIVGEFVDRVGARQVKRYTYRIQDSEVAFKLLNPSEVQNFASTPLSTSGLESFKPLFGKGSKAGQKKSCRKGTPCGGTCISASKVCRKAPGSASKAKIQEAKKKLGGAIATTPKKEKTDELPPLGTSERAVAIDEKYSKSNPTDADAQNWLKERIENDYEPSEENILAEALSIATLVDPFDVTDSVSRKYAASVKDRASFAEAAYSYEQMRGKANGARGKGDDETDPKYWEELLWTDADEDKLKSAKRRQTTGKTEASRKAATKEFEFLTTFKKSVPLDAKDYAAEAAKKFKAPKATRISQLETLFDERIKSTAAQLKKQSKEIKNGNPKAIDKATQALKTRLKINFETVSPYAGMSDSQKLESILRKGFQESSRNELNDLDAAKFYLRRSAGFEVSVKQAWDLKKRPTPADIKKEYRRLSLKLHPDAGGTAQSFRELTDDYERLLNDSERRRDRG